MTFQLDLKMTVQTDKSAFLANYSNNGRLIDFISSRCKELGVDTDQSLGDADYTIARTALKESLKAPSICLASDTDILIMLIHGENENSKGLYFGPSPFKTVNILEIRRLLGSSMQNLLQSYMVFRIITTPGIFSKGKKTIFELARRSPDGFK